MEDAHAGPGDDVRLSGVFAAVDCLANADAELPQPESQGLARDAERFGGKQLVAFGMAQDGGKKKSIELSHDLSVKIGCARRQSVVDERFQRMLLFDRG